MKTHPELTHPPLKEHHSGLSRKQIFNVLYTLIALTAIEFFVALATDWSMNIKNGIYIALTLAKAFFIVAFFMHLRFEKKTMIFVLLFPIVFILYFIILALIEGNHVLLLRLK